MGRQEFAGPVCNGRPRCCGSVKGLVVVMTAVTALIVCALFERGLVPPKVVALSEDDDDATEPGGRPSVQDPEIDEPPAPKKLDPAFGRSVQALFRKANGESSPPFIEIFPITANDTTELANIPITTSRRRITPFHFSSLRDKLIQARSAGAARITLFAEIGFSINVQSVTENTQQGLVKMRGTIDAEVYGALRLSVTDSGVYGFVHVDSSFFEIKPTFDGMVQISEIDYTHIPSGCAVEAPAPPSDPSPVSPDGCAEPVIRVLALVPNQTYLSILVLQLGMLLDRAGEERRIEDLLDVTFQRSGTLITSDVILEPINLPAPLVAGTEYLKDELHWLRTDPVPQARRDARNADVVCLLVGNPALVGGRATLNVCLYKEFAHFVVTLPFLYYDYGMAHELGHVMGMRHDQVLTGYVEPSDPCSDPTNRSPYIDKCNFGWVVVAGAKLTPTVMGSDRLCEFAFIPCSRPRTPVYSHPPASVLGSPCPTATSVAAWGANNLEQLKFAARRVEAFR